MTGVRKPCSWLDVHMDTIADNVRQIRMLPNCPRLFAAVIKANAYGLGATTIANYLALADSVDAFHVALVEEGVELRRSGIALPILVNAGSFEGMYDVMVDYSLTPIVGEEVDLVGFSEEAKRRDTTISVHVEFDIGMARNGFNVKDSEAVKQLALTLPRLRVIGTMGHLAHVGEKGAEKESFKRQEAHLQLVRKDFDKTNLAGHESNMGQNQLPSPGTDTEQGLWVRQDCRAYDGSSVSTFASSSSFDMPLLSTSGTSVASSDSYSLSSLEENTFHLANSARIASSYRTDPDSAQGDMARVGLAMYGIQPVESSLLPGLQLGIRWQTRVVAVRTIRAGDTVSYSGTWTARRTTRVATMCVGYADGYSRNLSNKASVLVAGRRARVIGCVCMDYTMVDVTDFKEDEVQVGTMVTLIGNEPQAPSVEEVAQWAGTIPWEVITRISPRVKRFYHEQTALDS